MLRLIPSLSLSLSSCSICIFARRLACLEDLEHKLGEGKQFFFLYTWLRRFPALKLQLWWENLPAPAEFPQRLLCAVSMAGLPVSAFPSPLKDADIETWCWRTALYKFHKGWESNMDRVSGPWQRGVENTRLRCHLLLSNIISLEGLMLRTGDAAPDDWTHKCWGGVAEHRELIDGSVSSVTQIKIFIRTIFIYQPKHRVSTHTYEANMPNIL